MVPQAATCKEFFGCVLLLLLLIGKSDEISEETNIFGFRSASWRDVTSSANQEGRHENARRLVQNASINRELARWQV